VRHIRWSLPPGQPGRFCPQNCMGSVSHKLGWYTPCPFQTQQSKDATTFLISMKFMAPHALGRFYLSFPGNARPQPGSSLASFFSSAVLGGVATVFAGLEPGAPRGVGKTSDFRTAKACFRFLFRQARLPVCLSSCSVAWIKKVMPPSNITGASSLTESGGKPHALPKCPLWTAKASFKLCLPASSLAGTAASRTP